MIDQRSTTGHPGPDGGEKVVASLSINRASEMSDAGRRLVAAWLREQAEYLVENGSALAPKFTARYLVG